MKFTLTTSHALCLLWSHLILGHVHDLQQTDENGENSKSGKETSWLRTAWRSNSFPHVHMFLQTTWKPPVVIHTFKLHFICASLNNKSYTCSIFHLLLCGFAVYSDNLRREGLSIFSSLGRLSPEPRATIINIPTVTSLETQGVAFGNTYNNINEASDSELKSLKNSIATDWIPVYIAMLHVTLLAATRGCYYWGTLWGSDCVETGSPLASRGRDWEGLRLTDLTLSVQDFTRELAF